MITAPKSINACLNAAAMAGNTTFMPSCRTPQLQNEKTASAHAVTNIHEYMLWQCCSLNRLELWKKKKKIDAHTVTLPVPRMRLPRPDVFPNSLCHNWWVAVILSFWCECFATRWRKLPRKLTFSDFLWSQLVEMQQKSGSPLFKNCGVSDDCKDEFGLSHVDTAKQECFASFFAAPRMTCHVGDIKSNEILLLQEMYSFTAFLCGHAYLQLKNIQKLMVRDNRK